MQTHRALRDGPPGNLVRYSIKNRLPDPMFVIAKVIYMQILYTCLRISISMDDQYFSRLLFQFPSKQIFLKFP